MQFNIDRMLDDINSSPSIIDVSSESGEEFTVEPGDVGALDERFSVGSTSSDAMSAFVGAAAASLFPSTPLPYQSEEVIDAAGSQIERQLTELVEEHQKLDSVSPPSFIDTEFEESPRNHQKTRRWTKVFHSTITAGPPLQFYQLREVEVGAQDQLPVRYQFTHQTTPRN